MKKLISNPLLALIFVFLCATIILNSCKKDNSLSPADEKTLLKLKSKTLLTKNSADLSSRLDVIKSEFLKRKLDAKFAPKKEGDIIWTPQWSDPKIQTVNDSVSYVFYHLKPEAKRDGKMIDVKEIGAVSYIMVKNETEFYEAFFYLPSNLRSKTPSKDTPETFMGKFTGKLLLTNLENKKNFLLDYKDGRVSDAYKKQMLESRKQLAVKGTTAYTQEICTTVTLGCSFTTDGFDGCWEEGIRVEYRTDCMYPSSCGNWRLTDIRTQTVCETFWFPDPPVDPGEGGGVNPPVPPTTAAIMDAIENKPFALFNDVDCAILQKWLALAQHTVDQSIITKLGTVGTSSSRIASVQSINDAHSTAVNMDYFSVTITQLPTVNGQQLTATQFHRYIRTHLNDFTDNVDFTPYNANGVDDNVLWNSTSPTGALIGIDMPLFDNGTVITSFSSSNTWTFTTVYEPMYGQHPVSGHRDFGFVENANGSFTFFTKGVDRLTTWDASAAQWMTGIAFTSADALWTSFQTKISTFVDNNSGAASINTPEILRPDWQLVKDVLDGKEPLSKLSKNCP